MKKRYLHLLLIVLVLCGQHQLNAQVDKNLVALNEPNRNKNNSFQDASVSLNFIKFKNSLNLAERFKAKGDTNSMLEKLVNNLNVDGVVRFSSIYRNMAEQYADNTTSNQNISFVDYPISNSGSAQLAGYPMLDLIFSTRLSKTVDFNVGYSIFYSFAGNQDNSTSNGRSLTAVNYLKFNGNVITPIGKFTINAGAAGLTASLSRMTMGIPANRDDYFDRLPWDWYRKSFGRYEDYYNLSVNVGNSPVGRSQLQGFTLNGNIAPLDLNVFALIGRTNFTVANKNTITDFPALVYAGRIEKPLFTRTLNGKIGANYYTRRGYLTNSSERLDANSIYSIDMSGRIKKLIVSAEFAGSNINNPLANVNGFGFFVKADMDKKLSTFPVGVEFYYINKNLVSLDGGVINSNSNVRLGGYEYNADNANEYLVYDNVLMPNLAQEVGILANNRVGLNLKAEKKFGKFGVQISSGTSQEIENMSNSVMIQHRVNAFSASRFRPWFQAAGPYSRIHSNWRRTFERFTISDPSNDYKKGYNSLDLFLKYKLMVAGRELLLFNFSNFSSIQKGVMPVIPVFGDAAFIRSFYNAFDAAYKLSPKYTIVGQYGYETVLGNTKIDMVLSDGGTLTTDPNLGKTVHQIGQSVGMGIDYDFSATAGIHLRHKFMWHEDKNFILDRYSGTETYLELKIFFK